MTKPFFETVTDIPILQCDEVLVNKHLYPSDVVEVAVKNSLVIHSYLNIDGFLPLENKSFRPSPSHRSIFGTVKNFRFSEGKKLLADIEVMDNFAGRYFLTYNHDNRLKFIVSSDVKFDEDSISPVLKVKKMDQVSVLAIRNMSAIPDLILQPSPRS